MKMESYYDSEEEIAWGPLTLREIKKEFGKKPKKVLKRQTAIGCLDYSTDVDSQSNASTAASAYFTPDESIQPEPSVNKNQVFLEQLSKVIDDDLDSVYATAADTTNTSKYENVENDTVLRILELQSPCNLDNIRQTLVENSLFISPDKKTPQKTELTVKETSEDEQSYSDLDEVLVISDSSSGDLSESENIPVCNFIKSEKRSKSPQLQNFITPSLQDEDLEDESSGTEDLMLELNRVKEKLAEYQKSASSSFSPEIEDWELDKNCGAEINNSVTTKESICENVDHPSSGIEDLQIIDSDTDDLQIISSDIEDNVQITSSELPCSDVENVQIPSSEFPCSDVENNVQISSSDLPCSDIEDLQLAGSESEEQEELYHHVDKEAAQQQKNQLEREQYLEQEHEIEDNQNFTEDIQEKMNLLDLEANELHLSRVASSTSNSSKDLLSLETSDKFLENPAPSLASTASEDSLNKSDSLAFNDTLEEMEMALQQGLDYVMPGEQSVTPKITLQVHVNLNCQQDIQSAKSEKKKPLRTPTSKKYDYVQSFVGDYIRKKSPSANCDNFKLPMKPPKCKLTPIRSPLVPTKSYKNIVSPIGVYIKNSPGVVLKKNVTAKTVANLNIFPVTEVSKSNKENVSNELPSVVYKPATRVKVSEKKDIVLPPSIKKLITEPLVTKHDKRINQRDLSETSVNRRLEAADLTSTSVDSGFLNQTDADMSFVTTKQAFIK